MIWDKLKNFKKTEKWGNAGRINGLLLLLLDEITSRVKKAALDDEEVASCVIHCGYDLSGHAAKSQHYLGNAVDFHFSGISAKKAYEIICGTLKDLQIENHVGLGVYPQWFNQGFHLDVRGERARWAQIYMKYVDIKKGVKLLK